MNAYTVICCSFVIFAVSYARDLQNEEAECLTEVNISRDDLKAFLTGKPSTEIPTIKTFIACLSKKFGVCDDNGDLDAKKLGELYINTYLADYNINVDNKETRVPTAAENCKSIKGSDCGDGVLQFHACILKELQS
ncbi:hypothetical protein FQR65_LT00271 [Abscondita terminalis]|nr:hypothetical protein FQR65_LT00271 [Abscondita terminalis]